MNLGRRSLCAAIATVLLAGGTTGASALPGLETWIVTFDDVPTVEDLEVLDGLAAAVHGFDHLPAAVVHITPLELGLLSGLPGVVGVWPDEDYEPLLAESTETIGADHAWDFGWDGSGIGIAVVDTGIDGSHPDLCAEITFCEGTDVKTVQNVKFLGRESRAEPVVYVEDQLITDTSSGHGSHVAGIAGGAGSGSVHDGKYAGVARGSDLIGLGVGDAVEAVNVLAAFDWVLANHEAYNIKVVNNSWGPGKGTPYDPQHPVNLAVDRMFAAGITTAFGAGNDGPTTDTMNAFSVHPQAISVAGGTKEGHIAFFSSRGVPGSDLWHPDVTAPGFQIVGPRAVTGFYANVGDLGGANPNLVDPADNARYATNSGTSMASPHVAGVVALMQQAAFDARGSFLSPTEVLDVLQRTAVRDGNGGPGGLPNYQSYTMGAGYVDAFAAAMAASLGTDLGPWDDGVTHDTGTFADTVPAGTLFTGGSFDIAIPVRADAISLDAMIDWAAAANDLDLELRNPSGTLVRSTFLGCAPQNEPNGYTSFCTNVPNERVNVNFPVPGTWTLRVRGAIANAPMDVTGVWSVVVPDSAGEVPEPAAATVTLTADVPVQTIGRDVVLSATALDADGNPVSDHAVTWTSAGVGEVRGEDTTHATGWAGGTATATSGLGIQTVTVTVDGASASVDILWIGIPGSDDGPDPDPDPVENTPGKVNGGGSQGGLHHAFNVRFDEGEEGPTGHAKFDHRDEGWVLRTTRIHHLVIDGDTAWVDGTAEVDGEDGWAFRVDLVDAGSPGKDGDELHLTVWAPDGTVFHDDGGPIETGNVKVTAH